VGELTARRGEARERMTEIDIEVLKLSTARREDAITRLRDIQYRELELAEQRRSLVERLSRLDIRAPVSGVVYGKTVYAPRSVIRPADPLMFLIPQDRPLVIGARISPIHVDQVQVGQSVRIRFTGLNTRTTPELEAVVIQVSADSFADEQTGSYFRAKMQLKDGELARLPEGAVLVPGMPVEAYIQTVDRTPLEYLVKPVADYFNRAFRES
jgi:HlyD family secretion protein